VGSVLAVVLGATACSSSGSDGLLIYKAQHESLAKEWIDAFTKETGIKVTYRQGEDTELGNQLMAEGDASPADVYNKAKLQPDQLPRSLLDLQQPAWKGRWGAAPTKADFQAIVAALGQLKGEAATAQWLAGMKANAVGYSDNIATLRAVNAGGRRQRDLSLLPVPRSGENQRDERQYGAVLLPQLRCCCGPPRRRRCGGNGAGVQHTGSAGAGGNHRSATLAGSR
jgi:hypothetical protein